MLSSDSIASAFWLVAGIAAFVFAMRVKGEQLRDKDNRISDLTNEVKTLRADKDKYIATLLEEIEQLEKRIDNKDDKAETMLGEIGDLKGDWNFERGIYARPESDALQEKKIENIRKQPSPYDEPPETPKKRGRHAQ